MTDTYITKPNNYDKYDMDNILAQLNYALRGLYGKGGTNTSSPDLTSFAQNFHKPIEQLVASGGGSKTEINFQALKGQLTGGFDMELTVYCSWANPPKTNISMYVNKDRTATNYYNMQIGGAGGTNNAVIIPNMVNNEIGMWYGRILITDGGIVMANGHYYSDQNTIIDTAWRYLTKLSDGLTQIDFVADQQGAIGVHSRFRLWPRIGRI